MPLFELCSGMQLALIFLKLPFIVLLDGAEELVQFAPLLRQYI